MQLASVYSFNNTFSKDVNAKWGIRYNVGECAAGAKKTKENKLSVLTLVGNTPWGKAPRGIRSGLVESVV